MRRETLFYYRLCLYLTAMAVIKSVTYTKNTWLTENDYQQQEEEEKAVINASKTTITHMVIPPYD